MRIIAAPMRMRNDEYPTRVGTSHADFVTGSVSCATGCHGLVKTDRLTSTFVSDTTSASVIDRRRPPSGLVTTDSIEP